MPPQHRWGKRFNPHITASYFMPKMQSKINFTKFVIHTNVVANATICIKDYGGKKGLLHPFGPLVPDTWTDIHRIKHNKYRDPHPCQLPIHLLERIILMSTDEGDTVLDPFLGTGTTAIAAKRLGRRYIGFELDQTYATIVHDKVKQQVSNSRIGNIWASVYLDEIVTLRDQDWEALQPEFHSPESPKAIDYTKIVLKGKMSPTPAVSQQETHQETQLRFAENREKYE